jgi:hypothetical protein
MTSVPQEQTSADDPVEATVEEEEETSGEEEPPGSVPLDVVFGILKNERRRLVLKYMGEMGSSTSLSDLAEHIASIENDKPANELGSQERKRVYVGLYQCHLPRMHDSGAIDFDKNRGTVEPGPNIDQFYEYLDQSEPTPQPWSRYYLAYAALSVALVTSSLLFFEAAATAVFALSITGFAVLAVLQASRSEA